jgi:hypothetical protein
MKKLLAAGLVAGSALVAAAPPAQAGASTDAALGLGAFAVFNQLVRGETVFHGIFYGRPAPVVVQRPVVIVQPPPPVVYVPPPPPRVVYVQPAPVVYYHTGWVPPGHQKAKHVYKHHYGHPKRHWR